MIPPWSLRRPACGQPLDDGPDGALEERLLELELLERLGLDHQLLQALLHGILAGAGSEANGDEQDGRGRQAGDDDLSGFHLSRP